MATLLKIHPLRETQNFCSKPMTDSMDDAGTMNGPFRATQRWNSIIKHLQDSVDTKPHKNKAKRYEGCFTGANAVDVLLPYLQQSGFERDISRENAVKLCQLLLEQSIFDDVLSQSQQSINTKPVFQDNNASYYRIGSEQRARSNSHFDHQLSQMSRSQTEKRSIDHDILKSSPFDRRKKLRSSFGVGKSKMEHRCDENDGATGFAGLFDRKKRKRASFGLGKLKTDGLPRMTEGNPSDTPLEKKKRKRNSFGLGKLKPEGSYNISGSLENIPRSGDKLRASFRLSRQKFEPKCGDLDSQGSLPERKKSRRSIGSFRLGKRTEVKNKDVETASVTSESSQVDTKSTSSRSSDVNIYCDRASVRLTRSKTSSRDDIDLNQIWKESTVQRLLQLVDLPLLEDILSCTEKFEARNDIGESLANGNTIKDDTTGSDPWFSSAIACLHSHPEGASIAASFLSSTNSQSQSSVHARKLLLFQTLTNHYAGRKHHLIPADLHEVLSAILGSLARGKTTRAIELTQVMMLIVGKKERDELKRLLGFMSAASTKNAVKLSYETDNRITLITTFTSLIIPSQVVTPVQEKNLVSFMVDCNDRIFKIPQLVEEAAKIRIARLKAGLKDISLETYCQRVTPQQYQLQCTTGTNIALHDLTNSIIDDIKTSLKDKKQHLQDMRKHHFTVYDKHFSHML
ncbi:DEP domain-containing protein 7-like isoform X1 [Asterias rubens]|uniref:DEP domain-containing protein 7-like isoform X1 n=1 Tax=Asterias rubens TaxID=7604 RepID=UPI001455A929|nr:DEP domain-containing protein 7-like isoform X1 [Asterias rubens]